MKCQMKDRDIRTERENGTIGMGIFFDANEGKTKPEFADDCDVNRIIDCFMKTGTIPNQGNFRVEYGDFSQVPDFTTAMNQLAEAGQSFDLLPAKVRDRFHNQPQNLLEFLAKVENQEEAYRMGLAEKPPKEPEMPAKPAEVKPPTEEPSVT